MRPGWREPCNLYTVVAMPPGSRKSAVFKAMVAPILHAERVLKETTAPLRARAKIEARAARARADSLAHAAENAYGSEHADKALAEAEAADLVADEIVVPPKPRLVADDVTPEGATSLLAEQGGRIAILSAEGGIFATIAGRYSSTPNLEVFLKGHVGDLLVVDRKTRDSEHIEHPALTLGLAVQPEVLADIAAMPGFRGRGLLARILYAIPASTVGSRQIGTPPPPPAVTEAYTANVRSLVLALADWTDPAVIPLSPAANNAVLHLEKTLEPRLHPDHGDLAPIVDWASKYIGAIVRIAGLLHLATHPDATRHPIGPDTIEAAARIGHYYLGHALAVFDLMGADPLIDHARQPWTGSSAATPFTRRELFTAIYRGRFRKVTELDPVLDLLDRARLHPSRATPTRYRRPASIAALRSPPTCCRSCTSRKSPPRRHPMTPSAASATSAVTTATRDQHPAPQQSTAGKAPTMATVPTPDSPTPGRTDDPLPSVPLPQLPTLISVSKAATVLGISRASAYRYAACGDLPTIRLGGRLYIVTARLRAFLEAA